MWHVLHRTMNYNPKLKYRGGYKVQISADSVGNKNNQNQKGKQQNKWKSRNCHDRHAS